MKRSVFIKMDSINKTSTPDFLKVDSSSLDNLTQYTSTHVIHRSSQPSIISTSYAPSRPSSINESHLFPTPTVLVVTASLMLINILFSCIADTYIAVFIVIHRDFRKKVVYIFVLSMCVNEIIDSCTDALSTAVLHLRQEWMYKGHVCTLQVISTVVFNSATYWHLVIISIHRLFVVCYNQTYARIPRKQYIILMLVIARLMPCTPLTLALFGPLGVPSRHIGRCQYRGVLNTSLIFGYEILFSSFIVCLCYLFIMIKLHPSTDSANVHRQAWRKHNTAVNKVVMSTYLVVVAGFLPYTMLTMFDTNYTIHGNVYVLLRLIAMYAKNCNPVLYALLDSELRRKLIRRRGSGGDKSADSSICM